MTAAVRGWWYNTLYQGCFLLLIHVFFLYFRLLSHIHGIYVMGPPRTSTNVRVLTYEYKLLYYRRCLLALLSFVWFAVFAASVAVVAFGPSVLSLPFLMLCTFFGGSGQKKVHLVRLGPKKGTY